MKIICRILISSALLLPGLVSSVDEYIDHQTPSEYSVTIPYTISSNRISDGIVSSNPFTTTSPSFPQYYGTQDQYILRNNHMPRRPPCSDSANGCLFQVMADKEWTPSKVILDYGKKYDISVSTTDQWTDGGVQSTADGYQIYYDANKLCWIRNGACCLECKEPPRFAANFMQLVCCIGDYQMQLTSVSDPSLVRMLPIDEGQVSQTCFPLGTGTYQVKAAITGELICYPNQPHGWYWDNAGTVGVDVVALP